MDTKNTPQGVSIHAGFPNPATDASLQNLNLNTLLVAHSLSTYFMRIAGDNWREMGIFDEDIVIIDRALAAGSNDLMVWWHEDIFALSPKHKVPKDAVTFGVVTATIHQYRRNNAQ